MMEKKRRVDTEAFFNEDETWYTALFNKIAVEWAGQSLPKSIVIKDETLREGEETPGVALSLEDKLRVVERLEEIGVKEIEVGYSGIVDEHFLLTQTLKKMNSPLHLSSHTRAYGKGDSWKTEIQRVIESGADRVNLVAKSSKSQLQATPWLKKEDMPQRIYDCVEYAKSKGSAVGFGLADPARTPLKEVVICYQSAFEAGADRLYIYDGPGCSTPEGIAYLTHLVRSISLDQCQLAVHCHNDFGLAVANSLAAVKKGATVVDTVVGGMGDRAGNASFEEVVCALEVLYSIDTGIDIERICALSSMVSTIYGIPISPLKPITGENAYRHETDSHVTCLLRGQWDSFEVIKAEAIGRERSLEFGASTLHGESGALEAKIERMGFDGVEGVVESTKAWLRDQLKRRPFVEEREIESYLIEICSRKGGK